MIIQAKTPVSILFGVISSRFIKGHTNTIIINMGIPHPIPVLYAFRILFFIELIYNPFSNQFW